MFVRERFPTFLGEGRRKTNSNREMVRDVRAPILHLGEGVYNPVASGANIPLTGADGVRGACNNFGCWLADGESVKLEIVED